MALCHHIARTTFALATLGGHTQFHLDVVKTHARFHMAGNVTVGYTQAEADDHGGNGSCGDAFGGEVFWT